MLLILCQTALAYSTEFQVFFLFFDQRASAALRAAVLRCDGVMLAVRAGPPFNPPSRPSATAAGFLYALDLIFMTGDFPSPRMHPIQPRGGDLTAGKTVVVELHPNEIG